MRDLLAVLLITCSLLHHSSYFFGRAWPPFYSSNYCLHILGMLGTDRSCICHSFLARWSPYFFGCNSTCWNWHFPILNGNMRYPNLITLGCPLSSSTFWKPNGSILSLVVGFFWQTAYTSMSLLYFSNKCSFKYHANTSLFMCKSKGKCLVISLSYHTYIWFIFSPFLYNTMYLGLPHPNVDYFSWC